jgi:hypothetical protein
VEKLFGALAGVQSSPLFTIVFYGVFSPLFLLLVGPANMAFADKGIPQEKQLMLEYEQSGISTFGVIHSFKEVFSVKWWAFFVPYFMFCPCWTMNVWHKFDFSYQNPEVDESGNRPSVGKRCFTLNRSDCETIPIMVLPGQPQSGYPQYLVDSGSNTRTPLSPFKVVGSEGSFGQSSWLPRFSDWSAWPVTDASYSFRAYCSSSGTFVLSSYIASSSMYW